MSNDEGNKDNKSFLSDLAAKMAAGPPKNPVGLLKKSHVAEQADEQAKKQLAESKEAQQKLANVLKQASAETNDEAEEDAEKPES